MVVETSYDGAKALTERMWLGAQLAYGRNRASKMGRRPGWTDLAQSNMTISLELTRSQILAFRRRAAALDERLPHGQHALRHAAWAGLQDSMPRAALLSIHARMAATESGSWEDASIVRNRKTLPPEISLCGARPNQEQTCFTAGKRSISVPISLCASVALCDNNPSPSVSDPAFGADMVCLAVQRCFWRDLRSRRVPSQRRSAPMIIPPRAFSSPPGLLLNTPTTPTTIIMLPSNTMLQPVEVRVVADGGNRPTLAQ